MMQFELFGITFNGIVMLSRFVDAFMTGIGFMSGVAIIFIFVSRYARKSTKARKLKPRVKLLNKRRCSECGVLEENAQHGFLINYGSRFTCMDCDFKHF